MQDNTTYQARYDRACKRILSEKIILGWILHECLEEYRNVEPAVIAERLIEGDPEVGVTALHQDASTSLLIDGMNSEDSSVEEGTVWFDIRFRALVPDSDQRIGMIVNVEAQSDFHPGYSLLQRATYYCGRMLSSQYGRTFTHSHYERLQKVCSIWICPHPSPRFRNTVTRYAMRERNVVGCAKADPREYDLIEIVLVCPDEDRQQPGDGILRLLGTLLASEEDASARRRVIGDEFGIPMTKRLSEEVGEMFDLSKGVLEKGYRRGMEAGIEQGLAQGVEQGLAQGIEQGIKQGREAGLAIGIEQGMAQGIEQGIEQGIAQEDALLARLAERLTELGRADELVPALSDRSLRQRMIEEFGLE